MAAPETRIRDASTSSPAASGTRITAGRTRDSRASSSASSSMASAGRTGASMRASALSARVSIRCRSTTGRATRPGVVRSRPRRRRRAAGRTRCAWPPDTVSSLAPMASSRSSTPITSALACAPSITTGRPPRNSMMARSTEVVAGLSDRLKVRRIIKNSGQQAFSRGERVVNRGEPPPKPSFRNGCTLPQARQNPNPGDGMAAMPDQQASPRPYGPAALSVPATPPMTHPMARMILPRLFVLAILGLGCAATAATLDGLAVEVTNTSEPILCAEKDNVAINFASSEVKHFQIEAVHPAYMGALSQDRWEPDWTACEDISEETSSKPHPTMSTLYEDGNVRIMGLSFAEFWRPSNVTVTIGDKVTQKIHLLQLLKKRDDKAIEVLVIYPGDGYWRIKPLPPEHLDWTSYGSSFLVGPVEFDQRPVVNLKDVAFHSATTAFPFTPAKCGKACVA